MNLYLLRHGKAVDIGEQGVRKDADRMLTPKGIATTHAMALLMARLGCAPAWVITSPLTRAVETARIAAKTLHVKSTPLVTSNLVPEASPENIIAELRSLQGDILLVGHLPHLERLAALLIGATTEGAVHMRKSAACLVQFAGHPAIGRGTLDWLLQPDVLKEPVT